MILSQNKICKPPPTHFQVKVRKIYFWDLPQQQQDIKMSNRLWGFHSTYTTLALSPELWTFHQWKTIKCENESQFWRCVVKYRLIKFLLFCWLNKGCVGGPYAVHIIFWRICPQCTEGRPKWSFIIKKWLIPPKSVPLLPRMDHLTTFL